MVSLLYRKAFLNQHFISMNLYILISTPQHRKYGGRILVSFLLFKELFSFFIVLLEI